MKYFNFKRNKFSTVLKKINFTIYNFSKIYKNIDFRRYSFYKLHKFIDFKRYNFSKIYKTINLKKYKYIQLYTFVFIFSSSLIYLSIPNFLNYDKSKIEKIICQGINVKCSIKGEIGYSFFPSPRLKLNELVIKDFIDANKNLGKIKRVEVKISLSNLYSKEKFIFKKINIYDAKFYFRLKNLKKYKKFYKNKFYSMPIKIIKSEINFLDNKKNIATIKNVNFKYKSNNKIDEGVL